MNDSTETTDVPLTSTGGAIHSAAAPSSSETNPSKPRPDKDATQAKPSLKALVGSILAAAIGVRSNKNRKADFSRRSIWPFVIGGIVFTVFFIVSLVLIAITAINA